MYKDPNQPAVYDFVTRLQFMHILDWGYDGPSRAALEAQLEEKTERWVYINELKEKIDAGE